MNKEDIVPKLLEKIKKDFQKKIEDNEIIANFDPLKSDYMDLNVYSQNIGSKLSDVLVENITKDVLPEGKMYFNIADRLITPMLKIDHNLVTTPAVELQTNMNHKVGLNIKGQKPEFNESRSKGLVDKIISYEDFDDAKWLLKEPIVNFSQSIVDDCVKANVEFQAKAGIKAVVERIAMGGTCEYCAKLAGRYTYPNVPDGVYSRHRACRCFVVYNPGDGKRQNVHTKKWENSSDKEKIKLRDAINKTSISTKDKVANNVSKLDTKPDIEDVTKEYIRNSTPKKGKISYPDGFVVKNHENEISTAEWILKNFGGDLHHIKETNVEYSADYLWNNKLWELKNPISIKNIGKILSKARVQIEKNPGGVILDIVDDENFINEIERKIVSKLQNNTDVIIKNSDKLIKIVRVKNK